MIFIIDIIETPFHGSELFWFIPLEWLIIKIILIAPKIYQWHLAVYGGNLPELKVNLSMQLPMWLGSSTMSPNRIRVKMNSWNPTPIIWMKHLIWVWCEIQIETPFYYFTLPWPWVLGLDLMIIIKLLLLYEDW